jgi:hypothetical protein
MDHFPRNDGRNSIEWLISFLAATNGFVVAVDGLSDDEVRLLERSGNRAGRPLLAGRS